jgi:antitoxin ParD1/3/4
MSKVTKISVALTKEMAASVKAAVASGDYASTSEVVRDGLRLWSLGRKQAEMAWLRRIYKEGIASGPPVPFDMDAIKKEARRRYESAKPARRARA